MIKSLGKLFRPAPASIELHASQTCPDCGSHLARDVDREGGRPRESHETTPDGWHCPNPDCPPQLLKRVALWASPEAMDIQGCDGAVVKQLVQRGLVRDGAEFYRLKVAELAALEGMTKQRAQQIFDAITASMKREAWRLLVGLGIPGIGVAEARALCRHFTSLDAMFAVGRERLANLEGVTEIMALQVTHWYADAANRRLVRRLEKAGLNFRCAGP